MVADMRILAGVLGLALLACGGADRTPSARSAEARAPATQPPDAIHAAWTPPAEGPSLLTGTIELDEQRRLTLSGVWPARVAGDRAIVEVDGASIEGDLMAGWRRVSCSRDPLRFSVGGVELEVPSGGFVELVGREGDRVRVAPLVQALSGDTQLVDESTVSEAACRPLPSAPSGDAASRGPLCLTGRPMDRADAALVPLSSGATLEVLEREGSWVRARVRTVGGELTGWAPTEQLEPEDPSRAGLTPVELTSPVRVAGLELPAGTLAWRTLGAVDCEDCAAGTAHLQIHVRSGERRAVLHVPESDGAVRPVSADAPAELPARSAWCVATGAARGSLSREAIRRVIRAHINEVRLCYEQRLDVRPQLEGRVVASFIIAGSGRVQSVVTHGPMDDRFVRRCIERNMRMWRFPEPEGGGVVGVNYPFILSSHE